jgi:hypothetical protein
MTLKTLNRFSYLFNSLLFFTILTFIFLKCQIKPKKMDLKQKSSYFFMLTIAIYTTNIKAQELYLGSP